MLERHKLQHMLQYRICFTPLSYMSICEFYYFVVLLLSALSIQAAIACECTATLSTIVPQRVILQIINSNSSATVSAASNAVRSYRYYSHALIPPLLRCSSSFSCSSRSSSSSGTILRLSSASEITNSSGRSRSRTTTATSVSSGAVSRRALAQELAHCALRTGIETTTSSTITNASTSTAALLPHSSVLEVSEVHADQADVIRRTQAQFVKDPTAASAHLLLLRAAAQQCQWPAAVAVEAAYTAGSCDQLLFAVPLAAALWQLRCAAAAVGQLAAALLL
jgi:hypothetical protein